MDSKKTEKFIKEIESDAWSDELKDLFVKAIYEKDERLLKQLREEEEKEKKSKSK